MDKRKLNAITWGFLILMVLIVALMLTSNLRRSSRVTLPETESGTADSTQLPVGGGTLRAVEVTPETVQTAIETLHRPESYRRNITVEYLWNGGSGTVEVTATVSGIWTRADETLADGRVRHAVTNGETSYIWYNDETDCFSGAAGAVSADTEQHIPTYEDVLLLSTASIAKADYRMVSDIHCIYVETEEDTWGYTQRYWVSVDTGLLVVAERLHQGEPVYRMAALELEQTIPEGSFLLPDGTDLLA